MHRELPGRPSGPRAPRVPVAMTIAGSDSGGGAGIQADLKTFAALGVHGTSAITSITAQNTYEVTRVYDLPGDMVYEQIRVVHEDMGIDAAKTGMLSNAEIIGYVARAVRDFGIKLVVDPVMVAKSGARLLREDAVEALRRELIPLALVVTPNAPEAEVLAGMRVRTAEDAAAAARRIHEAYGAGAVVVKGGHIKGEEVIDVLYYEGEVYTFKSGSTPEGCFHGAGCAYSAAIAAYLAKGFDVVAAVRHAKEFIDQAIKYGLKVGKGFCPVNPLAPLALDAERYRVLERVRRSSELILENQGRVVPHAPEVGINVVEALSPVYARGVEDVAGVQGRIVKCGGRLVRVGDARFGGSSHLARLVLALAERFPSIRGAVNVKYSPELIERAESLGYSVVFVDRAREPEELRGKEGGSMEWIALKAAESGKIPDLVYDVGGVGKEAMIRVLGETSLDAVGKLIRVLARE